MDEEYDLCQRGHRLSPDNVYRTGLSSRNCKTCKAEVVEFARYLRSLISPRRLVAMRLNDEWKYKALCRSKPEEFMFPPQGQPLGQQRALCAKCPVQRECFTVGLFEKHGFWGGYSAGERQEMRAGRRPIPMELLNLDEGQERESA